MPKHILLVAGDPSGDEHGAALVRALKDRDPHVKISALGGAHLQQIADRFLFPLVGLGGFGFWEPLFKIPKLLHARGLVKSLFKTGRPDLVIPIDYYGFNIHIARLARDFKIPVYYYISPQVWASRPHRIRELAKVVTEMLVIFPFEEDLYRKASVPVRFVGHPLLDKIPASQVPGASLSIGLFPGSRWSVAERHLPIMIGAAKILRRTFSQADYILFRPRELDESRYQPFLGPNPWLRLVCDPDYKRRKTLSLAISVSGTAALENTLLGIPMVVMYKLSALTYAIAKRLIRIPFVAIPNILAGKALVPELLQADATAEKIAAVSKALLENSDAYQQMRQNLLSLRTTLGEAGSTQRAADIIMKAL